VVVKKGDSVKFSREGYALRGKIIAVIAAGKSSDIGAPFVDRLYDVGTRDHESYVVKVGWKYYWPQNMDFL